MIVRGIFSVIFIGPLLGLLVWFFWQMRKFKRSARPFSKETSRPPGESLRREIMALDEKMVECFIWPVFAALVGVGLWFMPQPSPTTEMPPLWKTLVSILGIGTVAIAALWNAARLREYLERYRNLSLGFDGERHVGQALNRQMRRPEVNCVYHDFVFEHAGKKFNIDHVVAGPGGVFVIETKTRRKPLDANQKKQHKVAYDGARLKFPHGSTEEPIAQAEANARFFQEWLTGQLGHAITVTPIIVIPGWWIDYQNQGRGPAVINDAMIKSYAFHSNNPLEPITLNRIDAALWRENAESLN